MVGALTLTMFACGGSGKDALVGTWGVDKIDMSAMLEGMSAEEKAMYESFLPMMEEAMKSMEMTFNADGTMKMKAAMMGQETNEEGKWTLSEDEKTLTTDVKGKKEDMKIESLDGSTMVLAMDMDGSPAKLTMKKK